MYNFSFTVSLPVILLRPPWPSYFLQPEKLSAKTAKTNKIELRYIVCLFG
jgi:hypothetical protein